mmetsp:Transcript_47077/g.75862  ORF Transcript_47077/g.75862 Transcript_47077/m.75862 type:complete len:229 (+) Transcript_47077:444-1130(+)
MLRKSLRAWAPIVLPCATWRSMRFRATVGGLWQWCVLQTAARRAQHLYSRRTFRKPCTRLIRRCMRVTRRGTQYLHSCLLPAKRARSPRMPAPSKNGCTICHRPAQTSTVCVWSQCIRTRYSRTMCRIFANTLRSRASSCWRSHVASSSDCVRLQGHLALETSTPLYSPRRNSQTWASTVTTAPCAYGICLAFRKSRATFANTIVRATVVPYHSRTALKEQSFLRGEQ